MTVLGSLLTTLCSAGVADADLDELKEALEEDGRSGAAGMGEAVKGWRWPGCEGCVGRGEYRQ